jgi:hypothetical protein
MAISISAANNPAAPKTFLASLADRCTTQTLVFQFDPEHPPAIPENSSPDDEWHLADQETVPRFFSGTSDMRLKNRCLGFLHSGSFGLILVRHGQWAAYGWSSQPGRSRPPHMPPAAACLGAHWFFYFHTRRDLRGHGVMKGLIARMVQLISSQHPNPLILADTLIDNIAPQRAVLTSGFFPSGIYTTRVLPLPRIGNIPLTGFWNPDAPHPTRISSFS